MKKLLAMVMCVCLAVMFTACGKSKDQTDSEYVKEKGKLVIGITDYAPMDYEKTKGSGEWIGFDADMARLVGEELGVETEFVEISWDAKITELKSKKIDLIWNGMSITEERTENMFLSKPYIANAQIIIVPEGSAIKTRADLAGKKVALQRGSSALEAVQADEETYNAILNGGEIVEFDDNITAYLDLKSGRVDAFVVDKVVGEWIIKNN